MIDRFSFSKFRDMLKHFVGKLVAVDVEGYSFSGRLVCFGQNSNVFLKNDRTLIMVRGSCIKLLDPNKQ